jgi:hypothetical protein
MKNLALRFAISIFIFAFSLTLTWVFGAILLPTPDTITLPGLPESYYLEAEQYAVYSTLLDRYSFDKNRTLLVIINQTHSEELQNDLPPELISELTSNLVKSLRSLALQKTIDNYFDRNKQSEILRERFVTVRKYKLISPEEVKRYFREGGGGWDAFYRKYPKSTGLISLSRVGFNTAGNQAVVYVERDCGLLCGTGTYYSLAKKDGKWAVVQEYERWVS